MRLAFVTLVDLGGQSGQNLFAREVAGALARADGVELTLVCPRPSGGLPDALADAVAHVEFLSQKRRRDVSWQLAVQRDLAGVLRRRAPSLDGLVTSLKPGAILPPIFGYSYGLPQVLLVEGMEAQNVRKLAPFPGAGRVVDLVTTVNAAASVHVFASYDEAREWVGGLPFVDPENVEVFHHGVDTDLFRPLDQTESRRALPVELPRDAPIVGFVGSFKPYHSLPALLRAVESGSFDPPPHLLLVGDGPEHDRVAALASELGIGARVHMPGYVDHERVPQYVAACDLTYGVVDPTHWGSPMKVFEYLACARPVVAYDSPELSFVEAVDAGRLVAEVSPEAVVDALEALCGRTSTERERMGTAGREYIVANRTWAALADRIVTVLEPHV